MEAAEIGPSIRRATDHGDGDAVVGIGFEVVKAHIVHTLDPGKGVAVGTQVVGALRANGGCRIIGGEPASSAEFIGMETCEVKCVFLAGGQAVDHQICRIVRSESECGGREHLLARIPPGIHVCGIAGKANGGNRAR